MAERKAKDTEKEPSDAELLTEAGMVSPYDMFETDEELEREGVWLDFGTFRLKCASSGDANPAFAECYRKKLEPVAEALAAGLLDKGVEGKLLREAYAETIIKDADGAFVDRDGEPIPKTPEGYYQLLTDLPRLFTIVRRRTQSIESFRRQNDEATGNG